MAIILIVEDEIPINELIKRNVQSVGHRCISAFDGMKAIDKLAQQEIDRSCIARYYASRD
ncbi:hypothetical protein [Lysinibacillus parviboronicapiens]|uniref:hypothetical protein n=1 Tax=Lysinibacillus parviboronicapiens TaxID=436516 RepID=UPI001EE71D5C|nr:hypothetical protein [Lysinibacillus parviboronicapiens]